MRQIPTGSVLLIVSGAIILLRALGGLIVLRFNLDED